MAWYVGRRVLQMIPVFFGATLLVYALVFLLPGDPIAALCGQRQLAPGVAAQLRHQYHLDQPFIVQYLIYLKGIVHRRLRHVLLRPPGHRGHGRRPSRSPSGWRSWRSSSRSSSASAPA